MFFFSGTEILDLPLVVEYLGGSFGFKPGDMVGLMLPFSTSMLPANCCNETYLKNFHILTSLHRHRLRIQLDQKHYTASTLALSINKLARFD